MNPDSKTPVDDIKALEGTKKPPLNWEDGKREQPSNRGAGATSSAAGREFPNGDRGDASGRNLQQNAEVAGTPDSP